MKFLQSKNGMERASFDAVWPHLPCLPFRKIDFISKMVILFLNEINT